MKTLHLTLKKEWFDMILSGDKFEEYREIKPYWEKRFNANEWTISTHYFKRIIFKNGYSKDCPEMEVECKLIRKGVGLYVLGAPNYPVFIIELGKIIRVKNVLDKKPSPCTHPVYTQGSAMEGSKCVICGETKKD